MKVYFFLLVVALLSSQYINALPRQNGIKPDCSQYEDGETLPDSTSCSQYYMCVNGKALRKHCARGLYYDALSGLCNRAFLVDCNLNRLGTDIEDMIRDMPSFNLDVELDFEKDSRQDGFMEKIQGQAVTPAPCTTTTCTTTTCPTTTTTCTTTTCTTKKPTTATNTKAPCTKTPPCTTKTTCTTNKPTSATNTKAPCTKTPPCTTKTTCTTTTCTTNKPTSATNTKAPCTKTPPCTTKTTCTTTRTCTTTTTTCTTIPPCTKTPPCTEKASTNRISDNERNLRPLQYLSSSRDCLYLPNGTILLDFNHCRRRYYCENGIARRLYCPVGNWFDRETRTCQPSGSVTNCFANRP